MQLTIQTAYDGGVVMTIKGSLVASTVGDVRAVWMGNPASWMFYIVLHDTDFIDSIGLATLVQGLKIARQHDGELYLVAPSAPVRNLLRITAMDTVFPMLSEVPDVKPG
ncbi:MAG: STAS domain-containing protein [Anaerolinea sp.]|nr:STAS domain-containing protein [Anaerolinea sp.]